MNEGQHMDIAGARLFTAQHSQHRHLSSPSRHSYSEIAVRESEVNASDSAAHGRPDAEAQSLAERAVRREAAAWSEIFEHHYRSVFAFVRYRVRDASEAEDVASQVFEIAYSRANRFDYRGVPIQAWLLGIARNLCRDLAKKHGRRGYSAELDEAKTSQQPDATPAADLRQDLHAAMQYLTADQQDVLSLRFLLDRSVEDTARIMKRSEDAVKNLQRRALAAMERALTDADYPRGGTQ